MILYKFVTARRAFDVLKSGKIRFAQLSSLNDPFESIPKVNGYVTHELVLQMYDTIMNNPSLLDSVIDNAIEKNYNNLDSYKKFFISKKAFSSFIRRYMECAFEKLGTNFKDYFFNAIEANIEPTLDRIRQMVTAFMSDIVCVLSLSVAKTNVLMWSHYSDSHRGIAIGFGSDNPFFSKAMQIRYESERPIFDFSVLPSTESQKQAFAQKFLAVKNIAWQYEEEYRLINPSVSMELLDLSDSNGLPIYVSPFPTESVVEVILGCKSTENDEAFLRTILVPKYSEAKLYKSVLNSDGFQLSFQPL